MAPTAQVRFGEFRFDARNECLWRGPDAIALRPKAFAVLKHLVEHPRQLVTKQQLLDAVWPDTFVSDAVLKDSIRQLREALGDDASSPRYIETAHRRGYRFIGQITDDQPRAQVPTVVSAGVTLLGRDAELARMCGWVDRALGGERQIVFVTGEPGIGKTTLVNALLQQASTIPQVRIARGQCLEQYGAGEAYLPVLDALSRLGRGRGPSAWSRRCGGTRPPGSSSFPRCSLPRIEWSWGSRPAAPRASACCARWPRRWSR